MKTLRLADFLRELPPPLGYLGIRIEEIKLNKINLLIILLRKQVNQATLLSQFLNKLMVTIILQLIQLNKSEKF